MKASRLFMHSIRLPIESLFAICRAVARALIGGGGGVYSDIPVMSD